MRPWVTPLCIEKHLKQTFLVDIYHHKLNYGFHKKQQLNNKNKTKQKQKQKQNKKKLDHSHSTNSHV